MLKILQPKKSQMLFISIWKNETRMASFPQLLRWFLSLWIWPFYKGKYQKVEFLCNALYQLYKGSLRPLRGLGLQLHFKKTLGFHLLSPDTKENFPIAFGLIFYTLCQNNEWKKILFLKVLAESKMMLHPWQPYHKQQKIWCFK